MTNDVELRVRFVVDDRALSKLHAASFTYPAVPSSITADPWAQRLEQHSLTWVGAFAADKLRRVRPRLLERWQARLPA